MTVLVDRTGSGVDQPYVEAARVFRGAGTGIDRVYVGNNDFNAASGRTATVDVSLDGARRDPASARELRRAADRAARHERPGPAADPARRAHRRHRLRRLLRAPRRRSQRRRRGRGTTTGPPEATQFAALLDSGDGLAGQRVVTGRQHPVRELRDDGAGAAGRERPLDRRRPARQPPRLGGVGRPPRRHREPHAARAPVDRRRPDLVDRPPDRREREGAGRGRQQPRPGRVPLPAADGRACRTSAG